MLHTIGQWFGILSALCCLIGPFWKKKWQMLLNSVAANLFIIINLIMIGQGTSVIIMNSVAIVQIFLSLYHVLNNSSVKMAENIVFIIVYAVLGSLGIKNIFDVMPVIGSEVFMFSVFEKNEQKTRMWLLANALIYFVYFVIIGSSAALSQGLSVIMIVIALCNQNLYKSKGC